MKKTIIIYLVACIYSLTVNAQSIYVDSKVGNDQNPGTEEAPLQSIGKAAEVIASADNDTYVVKINPGLYVLEKPVFISTQKNMGNKRIVIEASILPDDTTWTPEKMPVITSISKKGDIPDEYFHFVASLLVNESHVTIRGLKFPGYFYPNTRYFPIARFNKEKTDLLVEQCLFVGDDDASHLQVGIIAHGDGVRADHCIFYGARNSLVFWEQGSNKIKTGNGITNSIIIGASQSGVWTAAPDKDFVFENNVVSECRHFWIKNGNNSTIYKMNNCVVVNNAHYTCAPSNAGIVPEDFEIKEHNVMKKGEVEVRKKASNTDDPLPVDYLHIIPETLGYDLGAGLFKTGKP